MMQHFLNFLSLHFGMRLGRRLIAACCLLGFSIPAMADLEGHYTSDSKCDMKIEKLDMERGMTDGYFRVVSEGNGTCHWDGFGVAKRTHMDVAAVVSLSANLSFADLNWMFGPDGGQVEITFFDNSGKVLNKQTYNRVE